MFTKILVLAVAVAVAFCSDHHYALKHHQAPHKQYRHPYEHQIKVHEPSSEEYKPESQGHAYSSPSVLHQGQGAVYEESQETTEHVAPVYQYVNEQSEENIHSAPVQHKYRPVYTPQHEVQTIRVPAHHKAPAYYRPSHEAHKPQAYYQPESQEVQNPHKAHYQPNEVNYHHTPEHHGTQEHIPVQAESHESHDEPIDYYAYPKYQYEYRVEDPHTGDNKFQHEIRDGDVVKGVYGLHEADGSYRTVEYSSDKHHGFSAVVKHSAPGQHLHIESHHQNAEDHHKN